MREEVFDNALQAGVLDVISSIQGFNVIIEVRLIIAVLQICSHNNRTNVIANIARKKLKYLT